MVFNRLYEYKIQKMTLGFKYNYRRTSWIKRKVR
jgi:hypothetical protein